MTRSVLHKSAVAKAVAASPFRQQMLHWRIRVLDMAEGEDCQSELVAGEAVLGVTQQALLLTKNAELLGPALAAIEAARGLIRACAMRGYAWRREDALAIDAAADYAADLYPKISSVIAAKAFMSYSKMVNM